jgi:peptidyl-prolyl cis-trans isomerase A (cyclophilin A)
LHLGSLPSIPKLAKGHLSFQAKVMPMKLFLALALGSFAAAALASPIRSKIVLVTIRTQLGNIEVELFPSKAPKTVANFLRYVRAGAYTDGVFHRTVTVGNQPDKKVKIEVVQAGARKGNKDFAPIAIERTSETGVKHVDGAISMARDKPDSATSDFFICIGAQPELDFGGKRNPDGQGFAAFGKVTKGMDVVMKIQASPAKEQTLTPPIRILGIDVHK